MKPEQAIKFAEKIHLLIHSVRLIDGYKPSTMDKKVSELVLEYFIEECEECKEVLIKKRSSPEIKEGFLNKLKGALG